MHAIWEGSLVFGLVNIPVKLYSASEDKSLGFNLLHKKDHSPIRYARICKLEDREIPYEDIVKGYEYAKGEYVILSDKDFEKANAVASHAIEIIEFSDQSDVDIRYFDKPYYLEPTQGATKAYALLRDALKKINKIAIAKITLRNRESLALLTSIDQVLVLNRIRFATEIRPFADLKLPKTSSNNKQEMAMALTLINQLSQPFKPEKFHDTYKEDLQKTILLKTKSKKPTAVAKIPTRTSAANLMKALKDSLKKSKPTRARKPKKAA